LNFQAAEGEEKSPNGTNGTKEEEPCTYETYPCSATVSLNSSELFFRSNLKGIFNRRAAKNFHLSILAGANRQSSGKVCEKA